MCDTTPASIQVVIGSPPRRGRARVVEPHSLEARSDAMRTGWDAQCADHVRRPADYSGHDLLLNTEIPQISAAW